MTSNNQTVNLSPPRHSLWCVPPRCVPREVSAAPVSLHTPPPSINSPSHAPTSADGACIWLWARRWACERPASFHRVASACVRRGGVGLGAHTSSSSAVGWTERVKETSKTLAQGKGRENGTNSESDHHQRIIQVALTAS